MTHKRLFSSTWYMPFIRFAGQGKPKVKELNVPKESYISAVSAVIRIPEATSTTLPPDV
jgi:hypothetical protein